MKSFIKYLYSKCLQILLFPFCLFPIRKNRLAFTGLTGGKGYDYSCNPRYLSDYIREHEKDTFEIYWMVTDPKRYRDEEEKDLHFVKHFTLRSFYYLLTAKVIITNGSYAPWFPFRKKQYLINTWHGGGAYKKIENDKPDANWVTRKRAEFCAKNIQLIVSSCQAASDRLFRRAFLYHGEILKCGMPRNDFLVCGNTEQADQKVRQTYQIDRKYRILLYAPTYRSNGKNQMPDFTGLRKVLEENGEKWYVLYRAHRYSEDDSAGLDPECSADVTDYPDMQELLAAADMLITDYSSCIWDYSFLYRPCFLYTPDLREYLAKTGFYVDIHEWPFPICENMEDLEKQIRSFNEEKNRARIMEHHQQMGSYESGHACEAVCSWIKQKSICEENA